MANCLVHGVGFGAETLVILPFGLALAWLLARRDWPGKLPVETLVMMPLVMPPVATGLLLLKALGRHGALGRFFHDTLDLDIVFTGARCWSRWG